MSDPLIVMQSDLERALTKSAAARKWAMIIDLRKCVGCHACTIGCMAENVTPPQLHYRPVYETESGKYPNVKRIWTPRPCMQCDNPACTSVCPVEATKKEKQGTAGGIVSIDYNTCIGCGSCVEACPYEARRVDDGGFYTEGTPKVQSYENRTFYEYESAWKRTEGAPVEKARKCHFCINRIAEKALPICVSTCIGRSTYFGDINDPSSLVFQILKSNKTVRAESVQDRGGVKELVYKDKPVTEPCVYYILQG